MEKKERKHRRGSLKWQMTNSYPAKYYPLFLVVIVVVFAVIYLAAPFL